MLLLLLNQDFDNFNLFKYKSFDLWLKTSDSKCILNVSTYDSN